MPAREKWTSGFIGCGLALLILGAGCSAGQVHVPGDGGQDAVDDAGTDAGADDGSVADGDGGLDAGDDGGGDAGDDGGADAGDDGGVDAGDDGGSDAGDDGGVDAGDDGGADAGDDGGSDAGDAGDGGADGDQEPLGSVSGVIRLDHFGYRPADPKRALLQDRPGVAVELRRLGDNALVATLTSSALAADEDSGDDLATVDLSAQTTPGAYYLYLPGEQIRSYAFQLAADVYSVVGAAAVKSFYFQRCNHDRAEPWATDALAGRPGLGGRWVDGACHPGDAQLGPGPGSPDHGLLDLRGGWHDAGDYQKTLWGRGMPEMLFAYELNPAVWTDGQLNIPESGNGAPDLLDELAWELDFYVRMQRPDGHFMSSAKGHNATTMSPPSASDEERVYFDCTSPSSSEWSGGGVSLGQATGNAVLSLAHAALVFRSAGLQTPGDRYATAALAGWNWLSTYSPVDATERRLRAAAAAAVYRMDSGQASAQNVAESFAWSTWDGLLPWDATPAEAIIASGAWHMLLNPAVGQPLKDTIADAVRQIYVDGLLDQAGAYGGMFGGPGNGWDYSWGSNRAQSSYGAHLMMAARLGVLGGHSQAALEEAALRYLHYLLGCNPLNMVYLTNMAAYGGEHASFQLYHGWFSHQGGDGDNGNPDYNGKPVGVDEPLYPYHPDDDAGSTYGPAPGLLVGGPNFYYSCAYDLPNRNDPPYAYRDFSAGCDWSGSACLACAWEITEPMAAYQGPFVLLVSFFMGAN